MKQKRQRLMNRCNLQNETHIFFIEDYKISNFGMIEGYHLLRVISKENFNKFNQTDRKQSTFNEKDYWNLSGAYKASKIKNNSNSKTRFMVGCQDLSKIRSC